MTFYDEPDDDPLLSPSMRQRVSEWDKGGGASDERFGKISQRYSRLIRYRFVFIGVCLLAIVLVAGYSVTLGAYSISYSDAYKVIFYHLVGREFPDTAIDYIVWDTRMPRIVFGVFGGAGLAVAGAVMQSVLKNPLADSYTTGVSSGAGFGATLAMTMGLTLTDMSSVVGFAFVFSLVPTAVIIGMSRIADSSPTTMIMAGIGIMYLFSAMTTVMMLWADPTDMASIYAWQVGSLSNGNVKVENIPVIVVASLIGIVTMCLLAKRINVLSTGDESAKSLGIDADKFRIILLVICGFLAASIVSFVGLVGFVGLVSPHIVRMFIGADNRYLIPASAIFGGMIMIVADQIGRTVLSVPLPVGVVMSFIGGPVFLWLIFRRHDQAW